MLLAFFNFLIILSHINAEWEIPEEFHPPKKLFERIGGYASFLSFAATPSNQIQNAVQVFLTTSLETKYSGILISDSANSLSNPNGCMLPFSSKKECYKLSQTEKIQRFDKVVKEDQCEFLNSTFLKLNIPNNGGYCSNEQLYNAKLGTNTTIFCKYPCSSNSKLELLRQQLSNSQFCKCGKCATVINPRAISNLSNHLQIDIFLQPSFYATISFTTDVKAISSNSSVDANHNDCPSIVSTTVNYFNANNTNTNVPRFWLKRGRFYCPSEITCPWEIFYVFYEDDPFFRPSYLFSAKVVILGIHVAIAEKALTFYTNKLW